MAAIRRADTSPERAVRSLLHRQGLRFRKDMRVVADGVSTRPDIVFTRRRIAIFIDGCFWHSCPIHGRLPKTNTDYWIPKLARNTERDARQAAALKSAGWHVLRFWTHEAPDAVAAQIESAVNARH